MELGSLIHDSTNLPDDVFEAGETKPKPPLKKTAANGAKNERKRNAPNEVCREGGVDEWIIAWTHQCYDIPQKSPTPNGDLANSGYRARLLRRNDSSRLPPSPPQVE